MRICHNTRNLLVLSESKTEIVLSEDTIRSRAGYCLRLYAGIPASGRKCVYILVLCKIWPIIQIFSIFYKFDININRRDPVSHTLSDNMNTDNTISQYE